MRKKSRLFFLLNALLLLAMWLFLCFSGAQSLLLGFLLVAGVCLYGGYYYEQVLKERENLKKMKLLIREKNWDAIFSKNNADDEIIRFIQDFIQGYRKDVTREHSALILDKEVQISTLQSQINPHFLYNTMESIRGQALMEGSTEIAKMAEALAAFFRYSIDQKGLFVSLRDEIKNAQNYVLIQQYRFRNKFDFTVNVDEEDLTIYDCILPKLTIQPIVENAIYHGLETKGGKGFVEIRIRGTEKRLLITISDNGIGIDPQTLRDMNDRLAQASEEADKRSVSGTGIALINVNKRIKLVFGYQYGVHLYSTQNRGTDVEIALPLMYNTPEGFGQ